MDIVCYKCGSSSKDKKFINYICIDCFISDKKRKIPDEILIKVCKICGKLKLKTWTDDDEKFKGELMEKFSKYNPTDVDIKENSVTITFFDKVYFDKDIKIIRDYIICDVCSKIKNKYYEAIIQIRKKEKKEKEIKKKEEDEMERKLEEIKDEIIKFLERKTFIVKVEKLKFGYDIYVGSTKAVLPLISLLKYPVKITKKLYGEVAGKKIYRTTFLLRV